MKRLTFILLLLVLVGCDNRPIQYTKHQLAVITYNCVQTAIARRDQNGAEQCERQYAQAVNLLGNR